jgi:hypothetical protein
MKRQRALVVVLRLLGILDLLALIAVVAPFDLMQASTTWSGLGPLPGDPVFNYLARSASAMYALHGATILFISFDVPRYERLIRFLAWVALGHGAVIVGIDLAAGMPAWWTAIEGPAFAATGLIVLAVHRRAVSREVEDLVAAGPVKLADRSAC